MRSNILKALANPVRLQLLTCLSKGPRNVTQLISNCGLSQSAVSQHLEKLRQAGLVSSRRDGKEIFYQLTSKKTAKISSLLQNFLKDS
jgi:DNA-binding transcriptional ArsR family regulator